MTSQLSLRLSVFSDGEIKVEEPGPIYPQLYRVPHDIEVTAYSGGSWRYMGDGYRAGQVRGAVLATGKPLPEVFRLLPEHQTVLNCDCQNLWWKLNPTLSKEKQSTLLGNELAFCNHTGFPGRRNCLTGSDVDQKFPVFDEPRVCGGAVLSGAESDGFLLIESILTSHIPGAEEVLAKPWLWFWMTSVRKDGGINLVMREAMDGIMTPVRIPLITNQPVKLPLSCLDKLPMGFIPSPTWMA